MMIAYLWKLLFELVFPFSKEVSHTSDLFHPRVLPKIVVDNREVSSESIQTSVVPSSSLRSAIFYSSSKPERLVKQPDYLRNYDCSLINAIEHVDTNSTHHPIQRYLDYDKLSSSFKDFILSFYVTS